LLKTQGSGIEVIQQQYIAGNSDGTDDQVSLVRCCRCVAAVLLLCCYREQVSLQPW